MAVPAEDHLIPRATYRLQLRPDFGFAAATAAVPYLAALGISHVYLSPVLQAAMGSTHGYDVVDPDRVSDQLGGEGAFLALVAAVKQAGMGILLDIVPNHMSIATREHVGSGNRWWLDVLENGGASHRAHYFDVDWSEANDGDAMDRVLLPVLIERYGRALSSGHLALANTRDSLEVHAGDLRLPVSPRSLGELVRRAGERLDHPELQYVGDALVALPKPGRHEAEGRARRQRHKAVLQQRLAELCTRPDCGSALAAIVDEVNADPSALDAFLEQQNYRLVHWSVVSSQLGYRRFFDITNLVGLRAEDPEVFAASHAKVLGWLADRVIDGVRIDHVDGLREPGAYLRRLRDAAPDAWIVVEKILATTERLPASWAADGTTGYEFIETIGSVFEAPEGERALTETFERYTGEPFDPRGHSRRARLEVMTDALHGELARLVTLGVRACGTSPACRDFTREEIELVLTELFAGYPAYRTYLGEPNAGSADDDRARIATAREAALVSRPELDHDLVDFLAAALGFELANPESHELARAAQQVTGAIIAKGDEDTLAYRQVRLLARCEVGCDLAGFAPSIETSHARLAAGSTRSLLATSTHDTKRGEDVRARLAVVSEVPADWDAAVRRWQQRAAAGWGEVTPDRVFEYAMWQTLVGAWPLSRERAGTWAEKATREARLRTSWRRPDASYETARDRWLDQIYGDRELLAEIAAFATELARHGDRNSLAQLLVKLVAPGVADFYQGCELRDDNLVDPDNRRPVDLALRARMLHELEGMDAAAVATTDLGAQKLWLIRRVLALPRITGAYEALAATGPHAHRVFAFRRGAVIAVVPRLGVGADGWRDTTLGLPDGAWRDAVSAQTHAGGAPIGEVWRDFPVALLTQDTPRLP
ncbi:MAG: malto-oligosyltrehalose synthase [Kofleriaceae bacterium]